MCTFLKNHPFAVEAFFKSSTVLTYAVPKEELQNLIPACLELDTLNNQFAFIAVALVNTTELRPKGFPKLMGNNFFLVGYRIFVRYKNLQGKSLRGLYILKSETNKKSMELLGSIFTRYKYQTIDYAESKNENYTILKSIKSGFNIVLENSANEVSLPKHSPFSDWKEARRFAGPLPYTFSFDVFKRKVLIVEGVRENWIPQPLKVIEQEISFLQTLKLNNLVLASAFEIKDIPYTWKKGIIEKW